MGNMGIFGPILGQKGGSIPHNGPYRPQKGGLIGHYGGYPPPWGGFDPKKGQKPPFFVSSKGVPLVDTFYVQVSVWKLPFFDHKFSRTSDFDEEDP